MKALLIILFTFSFNAYSNDVITWKWLDRQETELGKWVSTIGEKELIQIGQMTQRPDEIEKVRAFFPYLLPDAFFGKSMDMSCSPKFEELRKSKDTKAYNDWKQCIGELYNTEPPKWIKKALADLSKL
jgi:hypothetical protein